MVAFAQSTPQPGGITLTISNVKVNVATAVTTVSGTVGVTGSCSLCNIPPLTFTGWSTVAGYYSEGNLQVFNNTLDFSPSSLDSLPSSATFTSQTRAAWTNYSGYLIEIHAYQNGEVVVVGTAAAGTLGNNPTYTLGIQLPLFNDPTLGATVNKTDPAGNPSPLFPSSFGGVYNLILVVSIIVLFIGVALALFTKLGGAHPMGGLSQVLVMAFTSLIIMFIFPMVYDMIAQLINYLTMLIIAYPSPHVQDFAVNIQNLWNKASFAVGGSWTTMITTGLIAFAVWVMELIACIMVYMLGTVRILLMAAAIAAFPLAVSLKLIPFASKLGQMVEDILFGLILAAIMSGIVAAVANSLISQPNWALSALGGQMNWLAMVALLVIVLMPTVFAPLTATMMQTVSQTAMVGGGVAVAMGAGGGAVAAPGVAAAAGPAASAFKQGMAAGLMTPGASPLGAAIRGLGSGLQSGLSTFGSHLKQAGVPQGLLQNALVIGTTGVVGAIAPGASRTIRAAMPSPVMPSDVLATHAAAQQVEAAKPVLTQHDAFIGNLFSNAGSMTPQMNSIRVEQKQKLGADYYDPTTAEGQLQLRGWYEQRSGMSPQQIALSLQEHGKGNVDLFQKNAMYKDSHISQITKAKQEFKSHDPARHPGDLANYQWLADVRHGLNMD
jgi:hypothetical protein